MAGQPKPRISPLLEDAAYRESGEPLWRDRNADVELCLDQPRQLLASVPIAVVERGMLGSMTACRHEAEALYVPRSR